jgi:menaquinone-dependent protoporphyrinogen oxidase
MPVTDATVLVAYATTEGQTRLIAERVGDVATRRGATATLVDVSDPPADLDVASYDAVVVGGSIHAGRHQDSLSRFVAAHRDALERVPSAFFSVSLTAAGDDEASRAAVADYLTDFLAEASWAPDRTASFAGALKYSEYGFVKRLLMRRIVRGFGGDADGSRDYEYTDWDAVDRFAGDVLDLAAARAFAASDAPVTEPSE